MNFESIQHYHDSSPYKNPSDHPAEQLDDGISHCGYCGRLIARDESQVFDGEDTCEECYRELQNLQIRTKDVVAAHCPKGGLYA